jgi:hypothetical protein
MPYSPIKPAEAKSFVPFLGSRCPIASLTLSPSQYGSGVKTFGRFDIAGFSGIVGLIGKF